MNEHLVPEVSFYLDNPLLLSAYMAREIEKRTARLDPEIVIIRDDSPDHLIKAADHRVVAISDSTILNRTALPVFDMPKCVLTT